MEKAAILAEQNGVEVSGWKITTLASRREVRGAVCLSMLWLPDGAGKGNTLSSVIFSGSMY